MVGFISEVDLLWDLVSWFEGWMVVIGMEIYLFCLINCSLFDVECVVIVNVVGVDLMISLCCEI